MADWPARGSNSGTWDTPLKAYIDDLFSLSGAPTYDNLPAGTTLTVYYVDGTGWPERPTDRTDIIVVWSGGDENNPPVGAAVGVDKWDRPVS